MEKVIPLDCSQAYHSLEMDNEQLPQQLIFNFRSRTFAYQYLTQGLNKSYRSVQEFLKLVLKAKISAQWDDDISIADHAADELLQDIEVVFQRFELAGLKLSMSTSAIGHDDTIRLNF